MAQKKEINETTGQPEEDQNDQMPREEENGGTKPASPQPDSDG